MSWRKGISRTHCKQWVTYFLLALLCSFGAMADENVKPLPDEIKNLTKDQIFTPDTKIEMITPLKAKKDGVNADVWIKYKFLGGKPDSIKVIYCSTDGYDLEKAAVMSLREHDFSEDSTDLILQNKWLYINVVFGYGVYNPTIGLPNDSVQLVEVMPELIYKARPTYPTKAKHAGIEATVYVRVLVSKSGKPIDAKIEKREKVYDEYGFNDAVLRSVMQCKFKPAIQKGKPVNVWVSFPYEFRLSR